MKFLRTASTGRLLAVIAGLALAAVAGGAIAAAASGPGPVPKHRSLASALHKAITAHTVKGLSARITFTNNLIDSSNLQGKDPLLQGASGRLWLSSAHRLRLELQSDNGDAQIVVNGRSFWVADPAQNVVYEGTLPKDTAKSSSAKKESVPSVASINKELGTLAKHLTLSGAIPGDVAGQAAYTVRVAPKHDGGLLGDVQTAWDAARGVPLRFAVYAKGNPTPVLQLKASSISYGSVPASTFNVSPPSGAKVVKVASASTGSESKSASKAKHAKHAEASGVKAVAAKVGFKLAAPKSLIALPRQSVKLLDWGGKRAALVTFGKGLGGIAVIENRQAAGEKSPLSSSSGGGDGQAGFSLPTVRINGATGSELDTALGTVIQFSRGGVGYTVLGSVPPYAAEKAARAL